MCGPLKITTNNPETNLDADLLLKCIGMRINSGAYQSSLSDKMDEKNQLKVNEYFQVEDLENVFAIGDCCNSKEIKEAYIAGLHAGKKCLSCKIQVVLLHEYGCFYTSVKFEKAFIVRLVMRHQRRAQDALYVLKNYVLFLPHAQQMLVQFIHIDACSVLSRFYGENAKQR